MIKHIEFQIAERAFEEGWVYAATTQIADRQARRGDRFRPAGLAAAQQLTRSGHEVVLYEKDDRLGGLLRYGIPDFKNGKSTSSTAV